MIDTCAKLLEDYGDVIHLPVDIVVAKEFSADSPPETVAAKIARVVRALDLSRFDLKYSLGTLPHEKLMESLRLYANEVAPRVSRALEE